MSGNRRELLTPDEAAAEMGVSPKTFRTHKMGEKLEYSVVGTRRRYFRASVKAARLYPDVKRLTIKEWGKLYLAAARATRLPVPPPPPPPPIPPPNYRRYVDSPLVPHAGRTLLSGGADFPNRNHLYRVRGYEPWEGGHYRIRRRLERVYRRPLSRLK